MSDVHAIIGRAAEEAGNSVALRIAMQAHQTSQQALARIEAHDSACTERNKALEGYMQRTEASLAAMKGSISGLYDRFWLAAIAIIALLVAIIGWYVARYGVTPPAG